MPLIGTHELICDAKCRLSIPVAIWRALDKEREGDRFYLMPGRRVGTLHLVPEKTYDRECLHVPPLDLLSDETYEYVHFLRSNTELLDADSQGRVLLPERMMKLAGLQREVSLCGVGDRLELWDRAEHTKFSKGQWPGQAARRPTAIAEMQRINEQQAAQAAQNGTPRAS